MLPRFYWLIDGELAGCSRPGGSDPRAPAPPSTQAPAAGAAGGDDGLAPRADVARPPGVAVEDDALDRDLAWLRAQGIGAVLSLTELPLAEVALARHDLATLHLPVPDLHAPTPDDFLHALRFIDRQRMHGRAVAVHCLMGQGRTGTVLAAYRIRAGVAAAQALRELRALCPGAIGSPEQERALQLFAARRDWIL
jgi:atypical dual specificity phosphatase